MFCETRLVGFEVAWSVSAAVFPAMDFFQPWPAITLSMTKMGKTLFSLIQWKAAVALNQIVAESVQLHDIHTIFNCRSFLV